MKRISVLLLLAIFLSGCGMTGMRYSHVVPHNERTEGKTEGSAPAENYLEIRTALEEMLEAGQENGIIYTLNMDAQTVEENFAAAVSYIAVDAIGAYAVEDIAYEIGTNGGKTAVAVTVSYRHGAAELRRILQLDNTMRLQKAVTEAMEDCRPGMVMLVRNYTDVDIPQLVQTIARENPDIVMEFPEVSVGIYGSRTARVVELTFSYENTRDSLRQMQAQVRPVFDSAALYVSGDGSENQKLSQLFAFLMERFEYTVETSITPTYSLLRHGVGDSRAFATVFAAMCRRAGLECELVTGARNGEPWTWNMVRDGEYYRHVDLLASAEIGDFCEWTDEEMSGYVWDYSAYPECVPAEDTAADNAEQSTEPA